MSRAGNAMARSGLGPLLARLGVLRLGMILLALATVVLAPSMGMPMETSGWGLVRTVLAPVLAPIMFMLLLLDALMSRVFMIDQTGVARGRLRHIVILDLVLAAGLLAYWLPYFLA
jgi:hypothetical protein